MNQWWHIAIGPLGTNFSEIQIKIQNFSFMKMHLDMSSAKCQPLCPGEISYLSEAEWSIYASANCAIIGSGNGLLPEHCQAIIWNNADKLLIGPLRTNSVTFCNQNTIISFTKMHLKMLSAKCYPLCLSLIQPNILFTLIYILILYKFRVHFFHAPSQWETKLHCNVVSHWLGAWSFQIFYIQLPCGMKPSTPTLDMQSQS